MTDTFENIDDSLLEETDSETCSVQTPHSRDYNSAKTVFGNNKGSTKLNDKNEFEEIIEKKWTSFKVCQTIKFISTLINQRTMSSKKEGDILIKKNGSVGQQNYNPESWFQNLAENYEIIDSSKSNFGGEATNMVKNECRTMRREHTNTSHIKMFSKAVAKLWFDDLEHKSISAPNDFTFSSPC